MIMTYSMVALLGGFLYGICEVLFRGYTHWSMGIAGGICFSFIYYISGKSYIPMWKRAFICGGVITLVEFAAGIIVNLLLDWNVWDYSMQPLNVMGQICPLFTGCWILISVPAMLLCGAIREYMYSDKLK